MHGLVQNTARPLSANQADQPVGQRMLQQQDTVLGLFGDRERARDAIVALKDAGFAAEDISLLMPDRGAAQDLATDTGTHAGDGAATGAVAGGLLGDTVTWRL